LKPYETPAVELHQQFDRQRAAFAAHPFPTWPQRAERLRRIKRLLQRHEPALARAIDQDFAGRPAIETELAEVWPSLEETKSALRHGESWMAPRRAGVAKWFMPASAQVLPQPLGVVGIIVPWNYPLYLSIGPLVAALAAGNRAMVKLSEFTPAFSALMQALVSEVFDEDDVCIVTGGADVAAQFSALPFDHLLFTGSTPVGRRVMEAASANLTPVTLELGGKSPAVITPGYPLAHAVERILVGKLLNAGQTCIAPDYVLLPRAQVESFVSTARHTAQRLYPGGLADANFCSIINTRQYGRLAGYLDEAVAQGTRVESLFTGPARDDMRHRLGATLLVDPPAGSSTLREEIFGPLLPLVPYDHLDAALAHINARPRPLAMYWFDSNRTRTEHALQHTHAGGVTVNDTLLHIAQDSLPFGGVGASGMGHYHGRWGFETFSARKAVFLQARVNGMSLFLPPYSTTMRRRLLGWIKRF
jgi:coniferyl-aldehyde dehydrogenase